MCKTIIFSDVGDTRKVGCANSRSGPEKEWVKFSKLTTHSQRKYKTKRKNKSDFGFKLHIFTISFTG